MFGPHNFASINGFVYMVRGIATLVGTPVAGALVRHSNPYPDAYLGMSIMVGILLVAATAATTWVRAASSKIMAL